MRDMPWFDWPFFDERHGILAHELDQWAREKVAHIHGPDVDAACRTLVKELGEGGWLRNAVGGSDGAEEVIDTRAICLIRETLAYHNGLADFAFAMQGLGSGSLSIAGDPKLQQQYLPKVANGTAIAAFALSEPEAGSDVAAMQSSAQPDGDHYVLNGT